MTRRIAAAVAVVVVVAAAVLIVAARKGDEGGHYLVRAMFANAFTVIPGEEVKSAGVPIGTIKAIDVVGREAAVVLDITDDAFKDFREDAICTIRPQSLIGERFVECSLTVPRAPGQAEAPPLKPIESGPGKGELLLPSTNTVKPIDIDIVNNIFRLPYRERLTIILNELGTGLAANGDRLRAAVRSANPALRATEQVIGIFAEQNRELERIADAGDRALQPIARQSASVSRAVESMNTTAQATAERDSDLERGLERLPASLAAVRPTMQRLSALIDQMQPVATDLRSSAGDINRIIEGTGKMAKVGPESLSVLADTLDAGRDALLASNPMLKDARAFAKDGKPLAKNLGDLLESLKDTGGLERLMDFFYFSAASVNGYDEDGHYLRAQAMFTVCVTYTDTEGSCTARFQRPESAAASASSTKVPVRGANRDGSSAKPARRAAQPTQSNAAPISLPKALLPGSAAASGGRTPRSKNNGAAPAAKDDGSAAVLDYLMGG